MEVSMEEIEKRMKRLEIIYDEVLKERFAHIDERFNIVEMRLNTLELRLNALYEKTERDKTELIERMERGLASLRVELTEKIERGLASLRVELIERMERDKTELIERIEKGLASVRVELIERMEKDKRTIILWVIGAMLAFSTLNITGHFSIILCKFFIFYMRGLEYVLEEEVECL
jgi:uncharacterized protein YbcI